MGHGTRRSGSVDETKFTPSSQRKKINFHRRLPPRRGRDHCWLILLKFVNSANGVHRSANAVHYCNYANALCCGRNACALHDSLRRSASATSWLRRTPAGRRAVAGAEVDDLSGLRHIVGKLFVTARGTCPARLRYAAGGLPACCSTRRTTIRLPRMLHPGSPPEPLFSGAVRHQRVGVGIVDQFI